MNLRSFDAPRRRPVPERYRCDDGEERSIAPRTVFIFIKSHCDGCAAFHGGFQTPDWEAVVVATDDDVVASPAIVRASALVAALDVRSAPFFVAVDHQPLEVVSEGVPFDPEHLSTLLRSVS